MLSDPSKSTSKTHHQKAAGVVGGNLPYHLYCLRCPRLAIGFLVVSLSLRIRLALLVATCRTICTVCVAPDLLSSFRQLLGSWFSRLQAFVLLTYLCRDAE